MMLNYKYNNKKTNMLDTSDNNSFEKYFFVCLGNKWIIVSWRL